MEIIDRENKYAKLNFLSGYLITGAKHWYLKISYSFSYVYYPSVFLEIEKIDLKLPLLSIKKMRIISMGIISIVFFLLAAMAFGFGFLRGRDQVTGEIGSSHVLIGTIIAIILAGLGFLYLRTKFGRLRVLQTSAGLNRPMMLYASADIEELKSLRELIIKQQKALASGEPILHQPPPLPKS